MSRLVRFYVGGQPGDALWSGDQFRARASRAERVLWQHGVDGATVLPAIGIWKGELETSMVVELLIGGLPGDDTLRPLAEALRAEFGQDGVLVVELPAESFLAVRP